MRKDLTGKENVQEAALATNNRLTIPAANNKASIRCDSLSNSCISDSSSVDIYRYGKELEFIDNIRGRYKIDKVIGRGNFATVRKATFKNVNMQCAIRIVPKELL